MLQFVPVTKSRRDGYAVMGSFTRFRLAAAAAIVACAGSATDVPLSNEVNANGLSVVTEKTSYSVAELSPGNVGVRATLTAARDKAYYSNLGDAFNGAVDQNPLYVAEGSDGILERQSGDSWVKASSGILVEGVREVVLTPGKSYSLFASVSPPIQAGTYRLTVYVRESPGGERALAVRSATFEVR